LGILLDQNIDMPCSSLTILDDGEDSLSPGIRDSPSDGSSSQQERSGVHPAPLPIRQHLLLRRRRACPADCRPVSPSSAKIALRTPLPDILPAENDAVPAFCDADRRPIIGSRAPRGTKNTVAVPSARGQPQPHDLSEPPQCRWIGLPRSSDRAFSLPSLLCGIEDAGDGLPTTPAGSLPAPVGPQTKTLLPHSYARASPPLPDASDRH